MKQIPVRRFYDIHLEAMDDNGEKLEEILDRDIPCAISMAPFTIREHWYSDRQLELVKEIVKRKGSILGQQGDRHKCKYKHRFVDPWHENYCLYNKRLSYDEQREFMEKGRDTLFEFLGKYPEMYVPPNHLFDLTTLKVAMDLEYCLFAIRGLKNTESVFYTCNHQGIVVLPQRKIFEKSKFVYIHYDEIKDLEGIGKNSGSFNNIDIESHSSNENPKSVKKNINATYRLKFYRDLLKLFWKASKK